MSMIQTSRHRDVALGQFVRRPVSRQMISYLAEVASSVIRCEDSMTMPPHKQQQPTPPATPPQDDCEDSLIPSVERFIAELVHRSQVQVATLMSTLVYLDRLKARLPAVAKGGKCTVHRIFLACLILAAKNLNDSSPKNKHWARYSYGSSATTSTPFGFSLTEVNLMERQLLCLLDFNLRITREDLYDAFEPFLIPIVRRLEEKEREEEELELLRLEAELRERERYRPTARVTSRSRSPPAQKSDVSVRHLPTPSLSPEPQSRRRGSNASDCTHISMYSSGRDSDCSSVEEYISTPPSSSGPGLTSSAASSIASSENSPVAPAYVQPIPLSALSGGPKGGKKQPHKPSLFQRFWSRDDEHKHMQSRTATWVAEEQCELVYRIENGRPVLVQ